MLVKDLLKQDLPPTNADAKTRREHTLGSITHNLKHFSDHGKDTGEAIKKLHTVDSAKAKSELKRILVEIDKVRAEVASCLK
jgi:hypothetical protein